MNGYIDTLGMVEVIHYLRATNENSMGPWTAASAADTTKLLIEARHLKIASPPEGGRAPSGLFGLLIESLPRETASIRRLPANTIEIASSGANDWAITNVQLLQKVAAEILRPQLIELYSSIPFSMWADHDRRFRGIFDENFIGPISLALEVPETDLRILLAVSRDEAKMADLYRHFATTEAGQTMARAYVVSTLIRTWFHVFAAQVPSSPASRRANPRLTQVVFHPMRDNVLPKSAAEIACDPPSEVVCCLAEVALGIARRQRKIEQRIAVWGRTVSVARTAVASGSIDTREPVTGERAAEIAASGLDKAGVKVPSRILEDAVTIVSSAGFGLLTMFALTPWDALLASSGAALLLQRLHIADKAEDWGNVGRLTRLAEGPGGRVRVVHRIL